MKSSAIKVNQFSFQYGTKEILKDISFEVDQGEYISIIGPNGAGKSTLIKCLNRILKGGRGTIELFGKGLSQYSQKEIGTLIGYVSQSRDHVFPYTVYEFVLMGRYPYLNPLSMVNKIDRQIVDEALEMTGVSQFRSRLVQNLSGGEKQKVYLAGALAQKPKILLLDEPTTHLDPRYHSEIQNTISRINRESGITVLHVTHELNHIYFWSQRVLALKDGKLLFQGSPKEVLTEGNLKSIFNTDFSLLEHPATNNTIVVTEP